MGSLPAPIHNKFCERYGDEQYQVAVCSLQGFRQNMEDHHLVALSLENHKDYSLFGVFDGHGSDESSLYLSKNLAKYLNNLPSLEEDKDVIQCVLKMDEEFCKTADPSNGSTIVFSLIRLLNNNNNNNNNNETNDDIKDNDYEIRVFWAGDSRAVLWKEPTNPNPAIEKKDTENDDENDKENTEQTEKEKKDENNEVLDDDNDITMKDNDFQHFNILSSLFKVSLNNPNNIDNKIEPLHPISFVPLTIDHRPCADNMSEKLRVEEAGGTVQYDRVDGMLAVSRAFGDFCYKGNQNLTFDKQKVISVCESKKIYAKKGDYLLLFCDGLVEKWGNNHVVQYLSNKYFSAMDEQKNNNDNQQNCDPLYLLSDCLDAIVSKKDSTDNCSAMLVMLGCNGYEYIKKKQNKIKTFIPGPLFEWRKNEKFVDAYMKNAFKIFGYTDTSVLRKAAYIEDLKLLQEKNKLLNNSNDDNNNMKDIDLMIAEIKQYLINPELYNSNNEDEYQYNQYYDNVDSNSDEDNDNIDNNNNEILQQKFATPKIEPIPFEHDYDEYMVKFKEENQINENNTNLNETQNEGENENNKENDNQNNNNTKNEYNNNDNMNEEHIKNE